MLMKVQSRNRLVYDNISSGCCGAVVFQGNNATDLIRDLVKSILGRFSVILNIRSSSAHRVIAWIV